MQRKFTSTIAVIAIAFLFGWNFSNYADKNDPEVRISTIGSSSEGLGAKLEFANDKDMALFWKVWDLLDVDFYDDTELDDRAQVYGAIKGMVGSLNDSYTLFMDPQETKEFEDSLSGTLEGVGVELTVHEGQLVVISPLKDSPAESAGLQPKDIIYKINDELTTDMTVFEAIMKIRGPKGSSVHFTVVRPDAEDSIEMDITRDNINVASVEFEMKDEIAYVNIYQFSDSTNYEFNEIRRQMMLKDPKGLILDLRYNGGGYLDAAVDIISEFIEGEKKAVIIKRRKEEDNKIIYTNGNPHLAKIPLVVLVNEGSASASEIVTGAIQDYKRGYIIGQQTFGKGNVQELISLDDGSSLRMTVAEWHTPFDRSIHKVGITPDRIMENTEEDYENDKDPQLEEAIRYLGEM